MHFSACSLDSCPRRTSISFLHAVISPCRRHVSMQCSLTTHTCRTLHGSVIYGWSCACNGYCDLTLLLLVRDFTLHAWENCYLKLENYIKLWISMHSKHITWNTIDLVCMGSIYSWICILCHIWELESWLVNAIWNSHFSSSCNLHRYRSHCI